MSTESQFSIFKLRVFSSAVIAILFLSSLLYIRFLFYILMTILAIGMIMEWLNMCWKNLSLIALGFFVILVPIICLMIMHTRLEYSLTLVSYFLMIWCTDVFAMLGGKYFQGPKLASRISPNKTWSGLICGMSTSGLIALILYVTACDQALMHKINSYWCAFSFGATIAIVAQLSDLFVSYFKRKANIKDSGNIIPGHGGILDRFDSIIFSAPLFFMLVMIL
ncbi:cytidylyltransferase family protein [Orientia chuto str. Dubai]|uniref:Phosphatidate cytidylyltransferase n=1 Tax=Orientia chuto str. Dubai TaxID=1359168 RepID=A0A0F3MIL3_9RICK|nr:phosphatidate cytidylyltransferase [Candidatus Orientia mediorientalis]KJV55511.1 cytidylyltransferase family protein [Orientia chuto str. Dubai]